MARDSKETSESVAIDEERTDRWPARWPLWLAGAALIGVLHLWLTIGGGIALASHAFWRNVGGDTLMNVLGAESFLRDTAWHFPIGLTSRLLSGGQPLSIVYTDSAPWIAVLMKAMGLGVGRLSVMGTVAVLAIVLQPIAFALLLLSLGARRVESVLAGALLGAMLPAWYMRLIWHVALASHWIVVLALAVAATAVRTRVSGRVIAALVALGALSIGIHAYLFLMVAAVAAGALLSDVARVGRRAVPRAAVALAAFIAVSGLSAWVLGYGGGGGVDGFGRFSMNLLSPIVPQRSGIALALLGWEREFLDATRGQYEGFNYLGAGILLCVGFGVLLLLTKRPPAASFRPAVPLLTALLALTLMALSNKVYVGRWNVVNIPLPDAVMHLLNEVRSSGRMFWPVAYAGLAGALVLMERSTRRDLAAAILGSAIVLQLIDTGPLRRSLESEYRARPELKPKIDAALWGPNGRFAGRDMRMIPSYLCAWEDHEIMRQVALAASRSGATVEGGPSARIDPSLCRSEVVLRSATTRVPGQVDVLMTRFLPPAIVDEAARSRQCAPIEMGLVCGDARLSAMR